MDADAQDAPAVTIHVSGEFACFSRPEASVERLSYTWITPSAARALFEAVFWKPRIRYQIRRIEVLKPIRFINLKRNEIAKPIAANKADPFEQMMTDQHRQQRNATVLTDVAYRITAEMLLNADVPRRGDDDNHGKYHACLLRHLRKGQQFHQPYLGMREFAADVRLADPEQVAEPISESMDLGLMLYDFVYPEKKGRNKAWNNKDKVAPLYFRAVMKHGVIEVPSYDAVWRANQEATL